MTRRKLTVDDPLSPEEQIVLDCLKQFAASNPWTRGWCGASRIGLLLGCRSSWVHYRLKKLMERGLVVKAGNGPAYRATKGGKR